MSDRLVPGLVGELTIKVSRPSLASSYGSGSIDVLATPAMIALMENAARAAVEPLLAPGLVSVGTLVNVRHLAATPLGAEVSARAELLEVDNRRLVFRVEAHDAQEKIGEGLHERFIVDTARILARAQGKHRPSAPDASVS